MLEADFFTGNRRELAKRVGGGSIIMTANGLMQRNSDVTYPFRQESNFYYLTGLREPDLTLVIDGDEEFLVLPKLSNAELLFGGSLNRDEIAKRSGIKTIYDSAEGWAQVKKLQRSRKTVHTITAPPRRITGTDSFATNPSRKVFIEKLKRIHPSTTFKDLRNELTQMRQIKQKEEIEAIKKAISVTHQGTVRARKQLKPGVRGFELKAELDYEFSRNNVEHGFRPIIISGDDTCILHSTNLDRAVKKQDPVLFDVGAEYEHYSADITRTYFAGNPTKQLQAVFDAVLRTQEYAISILKPGLRFSEYALKVDEFIGEELIKLGLITKNKRSEVRKYFGHGVSHGLGLDVHDICDYKVLQENMVITVEPGIYIPEEGIGVRIEDDILITKTGAENLSKGIPLT